jgi:hypothetical protein
MAGTGTTRPSPRKASTVPPGNGAPAPWATARPIRSVPPARQDRLSHAGTITVSALIVAKTSWKTRGLRRMSIRPFDSQWQSVSSVIT